MAPPALLSLENYSDVQFRDVYHRRSQLVAPSANVIQKLYNHVTDDGSARLSGAELLTTDADGNVQYSLMLGTNAAPLSVDTLTSENLSSWTANSIFTATSDKITVRSTILTANNVSCNTLTLSADVRFANVTANNLVVHGNINIDTDTLTVDPDLNRVGIVQASPAYPLDVTGAVNATGNFFINGAQVLSGSTLGAGVTSSSLTTVGTLSNLTVDTAATATVGNLSVTGNSLSVGTSGLISLGSKKTRSFLRNLGNTAGSSFEVCSLTSANAAFFVEVTAIQNEGSTADSLVKHYTFPVNHTMYTHLTSFANNRRAIYPSFVSNGSETGLPDFNLEIEAAGAEPYVFKLRLVRRNSSSLVSAANIEVTVTVHDSRTAPVTIAPLTTQQSGQNTSLGQYRGSLITQYAPLGYVGIGDQTPSYLLDVDGEIRSTANVRVTGSGGFIGTIQTASQPNITTIGTLGELDVAGNTSVGNLSTNGILEVSGNATVGNVNSTGSLNGQSLNVTQKAEIGILELEEGEEKGVVLDVFGDTRTFNVISDGVFTGYMIAGNVDVQDNMTAKTLNVTNLATVQNVNVTGTNNTLDAYLYASANVVISNSTLGAGVDFFELQYLGSCVLDVHVVQFTTSANNSVSKSYTIPLQRGFSVSGRRRVLPTIGSRYRFPGEVPQNDIDLDISHNSGTQIRLGLSRSKINAESVETPVNLTVMMRITRNRYQGGSGGISGGWINTPYSNPFAHEVFPASLLYPINNITTSPNGVGICCEPRDSKYWFDVDGPSDGDNGRANFRGGVNLDSSKTDRCYLSFGNVWRLFYNPSTESLEIHKNEDPDDHTWSNYVVTGILAAQ
jgi:hypothetical protein